MRNRWVRAIIGFLWGLGLFFAIGYGLKSVFGSSTGSSTAAAPASTSEGPPPKLAWNDPILVSQVALKTGMILVALILWAMLRRPFREMGWRRPDWRNWAHVVWLGVAIVTMMVTATVSVLLGALHPLAMQFTFLQLIVVIWFLSSFSEEIYVRGLVQSWVADRDDSQANAILSPAIVCSATLFAAMHVPLIWSSAGRKGGLTTVIAMLFLGWACAALRARSGSLWSAIAAHVIGNVAGLPGSIVGIILYRVIYGDFPDFVKAAMKH
jgi:membrane protease YdiL (CAAX protease family)